MVDQHATATGSLLVIGKIELDPPAPQLSLHRAVLSLAQGDTLIRWCGATLDLARDLARNALQIAASRSGDPQARPWLIASNHLCPAMGFRSGRDRLRRALARV